MVYLILVFSFDIINCRHLSRVVSRQTRWRKFWDVILHHRRLIDDITPLFATDGSRILQNGVCYFSLHYWYAGTCLLAIEQNLCILHALCDIQFPNHHLNHIQGRETFKILLLANHKDQRSARRVITNLPKLTRRSNNPSQSKLKRLIITSFQLR